MGAYWRLGKPVLTDNENFKWRKGKPWIICDATVIKFGGGLNPVQMAKIILL